LRWVEERDKIIKKFKKQTVLISERPTYTEIYETIMMDLKRKKIFTEEGTILKMRECYHKKEIPNML
jgi:hypothetical protein